MTQPFDEFLAERKAASDSFVNGDIGPLLHVSSASDNASIYPPSGRVITGSLQVNAFNASGAARFARGSTNDFHTVSSGCDGDLGYWTGLQRSTVTIRGSGEQMPMALRVTEIYHRENGRWVLLHRHADPVHDL